VAQKKETLSRDDNIFYKWPHQENTETEVRCGVLFYEKATAIVGGDAIVVNETTKISDDEE
jgi:hypothetical protein